MTSEYDKAERRLTVRTDEQSGKVAKRLDAGRVEPWEVAHPLLVQIQPFPPNRERCSRFVSGAKNVLHFQSAGSSKLGNIMRLSSKRVLSRFRDGDIAQLGEHLLCTQRVAGSSPTISTRSPLEMIYSGWVSDYAGRKIIGY